MVPIQITVSLVYGISKVRKHLRPIKLARFLMPLFFCVTSPASFANDEVLEKLRAKTNREAVLLYLRNLVRQKTNVTEAFEKGVGEATAMSRLPQELQAFPQLLQDVLLEKQFLNRLTEESFLRSLNFSRDERDRIRRDLCGPMELALVTALNAFARDDAKTFLSQEALVKRFFLDEWRGSVENFARNQLETRMIIDIVELSASFRRAYFELHPNGLLFVDPYRASYWNPDFANYPNLLLELLTIGKSFESVEAANKASPKGYSKYNPEIFVSSTNWTILNTSKVIRDAFFVFLNTFAYDKMFYRILHFLYSGQDDAINAEIHEKFLAALRTTDERIQADITFTLGKERVAVLGTQESFRRRHLAFIMEISKEGDGYKTQALHGFTFVAAQTMATLSRFRADMLQTARDMGNEEAYFADIAFHHQAILASHDEFQDEFFEGCRRFDGRPLRYIAVNNGTDVLNNDIAFRTRVFALIESLSAESVAVALSEYALRINAMFFHPNFTEDYIDLIARMKLADKVLALDKSGGSRFTDGSRVFWLDHKALAEVRALSGCARVVSDL